MKFNFAYLKMIATEVSTALKAAGSTIPALEESTKKSGKLTTTRRKACKWQGLTRKSSLGEKV